MLTKAIDIFVIEHVDCLTKLLVGFCDLPEVDIRMDELTRTGWDSHKQRPWRFWGCRWRCHWLQPLVTT